MIAMDRTSAHDVREMGRVTSAMLTFLDEIDSRIVVIGTSNLYHHLIKLFCVDLIQLLVLIDIHMMI